MDDFYAARSSTSPPLPWSNFAPPFSKGGRPALDPQKVAKIERQLKSGTSINETARKLKVGVGTVHRIKTRMAEEAIAA
ncbi:hypothetical protein [Croceicoccus sp. Ery15]|uniref:hypothetical protein n=1 Tax=Croceicoccus sp. Ery15 TaxID=1703338 RepID=UPI001E4C697D|nr:hypothetical protein [Croceicoccus sp. Ery15]